MSELTRYALLSTIKANMQEALDRLYGQAIDRQADASFARKRMDELRSYGRLLYTNADKLLAARTTTPKVTNTLFAMMRDEVRVTNPILVTFHHAVSGPRGDEYLDIEAEVHLEERPVTHFPDGSVKPAIAILAEFPKPYGGEKQIYAFAAGGDTIDDKGRFVLSDDKMLEAATIVQEISLPQTQNEQEIEGTGLILGNPDAEAKLNAAFDVWLHTEGVDPNDNFFGRIHLTNADMARHIREGSPVGRNQIRKFEMLMDAKHLSVDDLTDHLVGDLGAKSIRDIVPAMSSDETPVVRERPVDEEYTQAVIAKAVEDLTGDRAEKTAGAIREFFTHLAEKMEVGEEMVWDMFQPEDAKTGSKFVKREDGLFLVAGYPINQR